MKKKFLVGLVTGLLIFGLVGLANAIVISPTSVVGNGSYNNLPVISDGVFPSEWTHWQTNTTWWVGTSPSFTFDYGQSYIINDIVLSVDNNDTYRVQYSSNNTDWTVLFDLNSSIGEVNWGMDTMATLSGHSEYQWQIDFSSVTAQYLRISAIGGDRYYSVGEFQVDGTPVPEPATMLLFGLGIIGLAGVGRKKLKK